MNSLVGTSLHAEVHLTFVCFACHAVNQQQAGADTYHSSNSPCRADTMLVDG